MTASERKARRKLKTAIDYYRDNPKDFLQFLYINDKNGKRLSFCWENLWPSQQDVFEQLLNGQYTAVVKARQIGFSTVVAAYLFWRWFVSENTITIAILSLKLTSSKHIFRKYKEFYLNLSDSLRQLRTLSENTRTEMVLADTGARIVCESIKSDEALRSFTCNYLHLSEYAMAEDPEALKASAFSSITPEGQIVIESTPSHPGDPLHEIVEDPASFNLLFYPWYLHPEYVDSEPIELTQAEQKIKFQFKLTDEQLAWRRKKATHLGELKFAREYPIDLIDAWLPGAEAYFVGLENLKKLPSPTKSPHIYAEPNRDDRYAIGVDVASGNEQDFSVVYVVSKVTYEPVAIWRSNLHTDEELADIIQFLSVKYNGASILMEHISFGLVIIKLLEQRGAKLLKEQWKPTMNSQPLLFTKIKSCIAQGLIKQLDSQTINELASVKCIEGKFVLPRNRNGHCDSVIALGLALHALDKLYLPQRGLLAEFERQDSMRNVKRWKSSFPKL